MQAPHLSDMALLCLPLADSDPAEIAIVGVQYSVPGDGGGIDVQSREPSHLIITQLTRITARLI